MMTVVPPWKANEGYILVGKSGAAVGVPMVRWHAQMRYRSLARAQTRLEALLTDDPAGLGRTLLLRQGPSVESGGHQRFIARKIHHRPNAKGGDELTTSDWLGGGHGSSLGKLQNNCRITPGIHVAHGSGCCL